MILNEKSIREAAKAVSRCSFPSSILSLFLLFCLSLREDDLKHKEEDNHGHPLNPDWKPALFLSGRKRRSSLLPGARLSAMSGNIWLNFTLRHRQKYTNLKSWGVLPDRQHASLQYEILLFNFKTCMESIYWDLI